MSDAEGGSDGCIFCRIARGEIPAARVAESERAIAFRDLTPQAPVHVLVIPRRHVRSLADAAEADGADGADGAADPSEIGEVMLLAARVAELEGIRESGYRVVLNTGGDGGQSVFHLHAHVLGGRKLGWPPG